jgi:Zn finger protein HypA/HybF involved in hydrogenase expression
MAKKIGTSIFVERSEKRHGKGTYDYSMSKYHRRDVKIIIICHVHGKFLQHPYHHWEGTGCPKCANEKSSALRAGTTEQFVQRAKNAHENKYNYEKSEFINQRIKVLITCPKHGDFWQLPDKHLRGAGCPECKAEKLHVLKKMPLEEFIRRAKKIFKNKYDYSKVKYFNNSTKVTIVCPIHGDFLQSPAVHLRGDECYKCGHDRTTKALTKTLENFIKDAIKVHGKKFDYSKSVYINTSDKKICIVCPLHGDFWQLPMYHLRGIGCPRCSASHGEMELDKISDKLGLRYELQKSFATLKNPETGYKLRFDRYFPDFNTLVEYDGPQHFKPVKYLKTKMLSKKESTKYFRYIKSTDDIKNKYAKNRGIQLIRIPYTKIKNIEDILKTAFLDRSLSLKKGTYGV